MTAHRRLATLVPPLMDADGGNVRKITDESNGVGSPDQISPSWSPDGTQLLYQQWNHWDSNYDLWIMNVADGSIVRKVSDKSQWGNYDDYAGHFSADGTQILYDSNRDRGSDWDIWRMDVDGGNTVKISNESQWGGNEDWWPEWSPDGTEIVFQSNRAKRSGGVQDIWVMDADGANPRKLTDGVGGDDTMPTWSSDGTRIAFQGTRTGTSEIYLIDAADGGNLYRLNDRSVDGGWIGISQMNDPDWWAPS